jgi:hypothetical protein
MTPEDAADPPSVPGRAELVFIGGARWPRPAARRLRWQGGNATWPLVELRVRDGRVRVRLRWGRQLLSRFLPDVEFRVEEVTVDPIHGGLPLPRNQGVRLTTAEQAGIIFWTFRQQDVIDALLAGGARIGEPDTVW